jgi:hypothetical protein
LAALIWQTQIPYNLFLKRQDTTVMATGFFIMILKTMLISCGTITNKRPKV